MRELLAQRTNWNSSLFQALRDLEIHRFYPNSSVRKHVCLTVVCMKGEKEFPLVVMAPSLYTVA